MLYLIFTWILGKVSLDSGTDTAVLYNLATTYTTCLTQLSRGLSGLPFW